MTDGTYYATQTLIGGADVNRRAIYKKGSSQVICVFNHELGLWTPELQRLLDITLWALNNVTAPPK